VVDVSGKGVDAGARSMLLSGAFGGLLGALPPGEFLPAANAFLLRQDWDEGFATAVHLWVELTTGRFELRSAGHPPATQYRASAGRWVVHPTEGPLLGVVRDAPFNPVTGELGPGDAMLLYTDGLVERSRRDISLGIDKLLGVGERVAQRGFEGSARGFVDQVGAVGDDGALVVVHRRF
jgi:serine phosphatase RsbU (regulator of sigma subunit)